MIKKRRFQGRIHRNSRFNYQSLLSITLISFVILLGNKNLFYFDNGKGGNDWIIGKPSISILNAHQSRSLSESRKLATELVNRDRQLNGLAPLEEDPLLSKTAQLHAEDMLARNYYDHITPEGKTPTDRFNTLGGQGGVGENILQQTGAIGITLNYRLIEECQRGWMYSKGHRENLLTPEYTRFGYGIVTDPMTGQVYGVQNFQ